MNIDENREEIKRLVRFLGEILATCTQVIENSTEEGDSEVIIRFVDGPHKLLEKLVDNDDIEKILLSLIVDKSKHFTH
jgi:hypothetical protein